MPIQQLSLRRIREHQMHAPYLDVVYINPQTNKRFKTIALIDTGADRCVIPSHLAKFLGYSNQEKTIVQVRGIGGQVTCYSHIMQIEVKNFCTDGVEIIFSDNVCEPILGVSTFFKNFCLTIDYPNNRFSLRLPDKLNQTIVNWNTP